ncbi:MAG: SUMF1/EgtB/PvdO family nonheme iron enzyme [Chthoniobacterales bacterium]|nr:SUMF1/EgtB/PvdO family nonheme iron enzyme [Chthoniobacterales bacterium]
MSNGAVITNVIKVVIFSITRFALTNPLSSLRFILFFLLSCSTLWSKIEIPLVTVDCPNNPSDSRNGRGTVPYVYQIGKFDITVKQYCAFLNSVASHSDPFGLYDDFWMNEDLFVFEIEKQKKWECSFLCKNWRCSYFYIAKQGRENLPIVGINLYRAMRFCNWMENGQPEGEENAQTTEDGSYQIIKGIYFLQREHAHWVIMTWDEWYKAAYCNRNNPTVYWNYATQSNEAPGNSADPKDNQPDSPQKNVNYCLHGKPTITSPFVDRSPGLFPDPADLTSVGCFQSSPGPFGSYDMTGNTSQLVTYQVDRLTFIGGSHYDGMKWGAGVMSEPIDALSNGSAVLRDNFFLNCFSRRYDYRNCTSGFRLTYLEHPEEVTSSQRSCLHGSEEK